MFFLQPSQRKPPLAKAKGGDFQITSYFRIFPDMSRTARDLCRLLMLRIRSRQLLRSWHHLKNKIKKGYYLFLLPRLLLGGRLLLVATFLVLPTFLGAGGFFIKSYSDITIKIARVTYAILG